MIASKLTQLEIEVTRILDRLRRLEQIPLRSAAKLLHKSPDWVRSNLPVVILGAKSHRVRATDIEAFLKKRTIRPQLNGKKVVTTNKRRIRTLTSRMPTHQNI